MQHLSVPRLPWAAASVCLLLAAGSAQDPGAEPAPIAPIVPPAGVAGSWRVPIHTQATDPVGGSYGTWAVGEDYKASFHDGFVFYPYRGPDAENTPLRWTTLAVTAGGTPLCDLSHAAEAHTDWRYEYRHAAFTEAYDVRADGVEQSFVLDRRPASAGDVVVTGRFTTTLMPVQPSLSAANTAIEFADPGHGPIVRYGAAHAIDALGRTTPVTTSLTDLEVRLCVPGNWLAHARYPVVIDPLTSRVAISYTGRPDFTAIQYEAESASSNVLVSYARQFSASDYDLYARLCNSDFGNNVQVFTDVTTSWSTVFPDIAFVGAADRWIIAFWRHFTTGETRVRLQFHDKANTTLNSGLTAFHDPSASEHDSFPSIGGRRNPNAGTGSTALLTYRSDPFYGNSPTSKVWGVLVNADTRTISALRVQISRPNLDAEAPDVNSQLGWNDDGWVVVYEGTNGAPDDYDVYVARVSTSGAPLGDIFVGPDSGGDKTRPVVEGRDGRYLVAMLADPAPESGGQRWARNVWTERFDWTSAMALPVKFGPYLLLSNANQDVSHLRLAYDATTTSHWCLVYQADSVAAPHSYARRLGYTGAPTETVQLDSGSSGRYHPSVAWNANDREFPIVYCSTEPTQPVYGQSLQYPTDAINVPYGLGCTPTSYNLGADAPYAGSHFFAMHFAGLPAGHVLLLALSLAPASIDLSGAGLTGCTLLVDPASAAFLGTIALVTNAGGTDIPLPLPDRPLFQQNLYAQAFWIAPNYNPASIAATRGLRMQVR